MKITRISPMTGKKHTRELDVTPDQVASWVAGTLIQVAMPQLNVEEREFMITGMTGEEFDEATGGDEDAADTPIEDDGHPAMRALDRQTESLENELIRILNAAYPPRRES
jgi:Spy/CpxP family protein refolding chaperone